MLVNGSLATVGKHSILRRLSLLKISIKGLYSGAKTQLRCEKSTTGLS